MCGTSEDTEALQRAHPSELGHTYLLSQGTGKPRGASSPLLTLQGDSMGWELS